MQFNRKKYKVDESDKSSRRKTPPNRDEFIEMLKTKIAGETVSWKEYERFNIGALPKTLSTLMHVQKAEAYMEAAQGKVLTPGMKISIITIVIIAFIAMIALYVARSMGFLG